MSGLPVRVCWRDRSRLSARVFAAKSSATMDTIKQLVLLRGVDIAMSRNSRIRCLLRCNGDLCGDKGSDRRALCNICKGYSSSCVWSAGRIWKRALYPILVIDVGLIETAKVGCDFVIDNNRTGRQIWISWYTG